MILRLMLQPNPLPLTLPLHPSKIPLQKPIKAPPLCPFRNSQTPPWNPPSPPTRVWPRRLPASFFQTSKQRLINPKLTPTSPNTSGLVPRMRLPSQPIPVLTWLIKCLHSPLPINPPSSLTPSGVTNTITTNLLQPSDSYTSIRTGSPTHAPIYRPLPSSPTPTNFIPTGFYAQK